MDKIKTRNWNGKGFSTHAGNHICRNKLLKWSFFHGWEYSISSWLQAMLLGVYIIEIVEIVSMYSDYLGIWKILFQCFISGDYQKDRNTNI